MSLNKHIIHYLKASTYYMLWSIYVMIKQLHIELKMD